RAKGDAVKVALARRLRAQRPMTRPWIAKRLGMGSASYVSALLSSVNSKRFNPASTPILMNLRCMVRSLVRFLYDSAIKLCDFPINLAVCTVPYSRVRLELHG